MREPRIPGYRRVNHNPVAQFGDTPINVYNDKVTEGFAFERKGTRYIAFWKNGSEGVILKAHRSDVSDRPDPHTETFKFIADELQNPSQDPDRDLNGAEASYVMALLEKELPEACKAQFREGLGILKETARTRGAHRYWDWPYYENPARPEPSV